ncbi:MAG: hypothetical protein WD267_05345 [Balneolales bacterium]
MDRYDNSCPLTQKQLIDDHFMRQRNHMLEIAAFLDRMQRSVTKNGEDDFRMQAFHESLKELISDQPDKVKRIQMILSDPEIEPLVERDVQGAFGANNPNKQGV